MNQTMQPYVSSIKCCGCSREFDDVKAFSLHCHHRCNKDKACSFRQGIITEWKRDGPGLLGQVVERPLPGPAGDSRSHPRPQQKAPACDPDSDASDDRMLDIPPQDDDDDDIDSAADQTAVQAVPLRSMSTIIDLLHSIRVTGDHSVLDPVGLELVRDGSRFKRFKQASSTVHSRIDFEHLPIPCTRSDAEAFDIYCRADMSQALGGDMLKGLQHNPALGKKRISYTTFKSMEAKLLKEFRMKDDIRCVDLWTGINQYPTIHINTSQYNLLLLFTVQYDDLHEDTDFIHVVCAELDGDQPVRAYFRDMLTVQKEILCDTRLDGHLLTNFEMRVNKHGSRVIGEINTGLLYEGWQHYVDSTFPGKAIALCPGVGYSDGTVLRKSQGCYMVYTSLLCIPLQKRTQPWTWTLLGVIPTLDKDVVSKMRSETGPFGQPFRKVDITNAFLHAVMVRFVEQTRKPLLVKWGGKELRRVLFFLGIWLGDMPELQCIMGEMPHTCIRCCCPSRSLSQTWGNFPPKTNFGQQSKIRNAAAGKWPGWALALRRTELHPRPRPLLVPDADGFRSRTPECTDAQYERVRRKIGCHLLEYAFHSVPGFDPHVQVTVQYTLIHIKT